ATPEADSARSRGWRRRRSGWLGWGRGQRGSGGGRLLGRECPQAEVEDGGGEGGDRRGEGRGDGAEDDADDRAVGDGAADQGEDDAGDGGDQEGDKDDAEDVPAVARDQLARTAEGGEDAGALDDDHGSEHGPDRQQDQAGDDQQEEADADRDAGEDAGRDQRQHHRPGGVDQVAGGGVAAAILDIADEADDHPLVEGRGDRADHDQDREESEVAADQA